MKKGTRSIRVAKPCVASIRGPHRKSKLLLRHIMTEAQIAACRRLGAGYVRLEQELQKFLGDLENDPDWQRG